MLVRNLSALLIAIVVLGFAGCTSSDPSATPKATGSGDRLQDAIDSTAAQLKGEAKTLYDAALAAEPFPRQDELIFGKFHGEFKEEGFESYYEYDRQPAGVVNHVSVDMYLEDKEYMRIEDTFPWKSTGRVIYELNNNDPDLVYIFLLDEVTDEKLKYRIIDPEFGLDEVSESEDLRGPGSLPEVPEDFTEIEA